LEERRTPTILTVTTLLDNVDGSLRAEVLQAQDGDTVQFAYGLSGQIVLTAGEIAVDHSISIEGPGADVITVSGNHASRVFRIEPTSTVGISGLGIADANGGYSDGGGIANAGTLTLTDCTMNGCFCEDEGGAVWNSGTLTVTGSNFSGNSAVISILGNFGTLTLSGSTFVSNDGGNGIEGIHNTGMGTIAECRFQASGNIFNTGTLTLTDSMISGNSTAGRAGGILNAGPMTIMGCTISGNSALSDGGGIANGGPLTIINSTISDNRALFAGGGISNSSTALTIISSTIANNFGIGGGISSQATISMRNTIVANNANGDVDSRLVSGDHNLINQSVHLGPLQDNGGPTPTRALLTGREALDAGAPDLLGSPDQRGVVRTGGVNIGAYQASATAFLVTASRKVQAGVPFTVTVTAVDPFGQVALGYTGTVTFSASEPDPGVILPADYTFTLADAGAHNFTDTGREETTLLTHGRQTITVVDAADGSVTGQATVRVRRSRLAPAPAPAQGAVSATPMPGAAALLPALWIDGFDEFGPFPYAFAGVAP
jgi:hypothetical protein